jgi:predicted phosphodiesterase
MPCARSERSSLQRSNALRSCGVDLVLAGHKHVPYAWPVAEMLVVTSGTGASYRTRGGVPPSFDLIRITRKNIEVTVQDSGSGARVTEVFERRPARPEVRTAPSR